MRLEHNYRTQNDVGELHEGATCHIDGHSQRDDAQGWAVRLHNITAQMISVAANSAKEQVAIGPLLLTACRVNSISILRIKSRRQVPSTDSSSSPPPPENAAILGFYNTHAAGSCEFQALAFDTASILVRNSTLRFYLKSSHFQSVLLSFHGSSTYVHLKTSVIVSTVVDLQDSTIWGLISTPDGTMNQTQFFARNSSVEDFEISSPCANCTIFMFELKKLKHIHLVALGPSITIRLERVTMTPSSNFGVSIWISQSVQHLTLQLIDVTTTSTSPVFRLLLRNGAQITETYNVTLQRFHQPPHMATLINGMMDYVAPKKWYFLIAHSEVRDVVLSRISSIAHHFFITFVNNIPWRRTPSCAFPGYQRTDMFR